MAVDAINKVSEVRRTIEELDCSPGGSTSHSNVSSPVHANMPVRDGSRRSSMGGLVESGFRGGPSKRKSKHPKDGKKNGY